jgi:general secretion pathway protein D
VEVNQTDLEEIGFEWLLNDNWELMTKGGSGPVGSQERIQLDANAVNGGATRGLRFWGPDSTGLLQPMAGGQGDYGGILSLSSVLTNPELSLVLHALEQNGHADVLSAPKVTTRSGQEASIRVVTEYIYPTEFTVQGGTVAAGVGGTVTAGILQEPYAVPESFETREVGVILRVTPEVSPEGNMINLTMTPEVVTEPTFYQYGTTIRRADGSTVTLNMPQPFFHTRAISTSISIYDGATVVMGGLITEYLTTYNDKVPFLGDIPFLGLLFQSKGTRSEKKNLLIFVTARLVDPAGRPIRKPSTESGLGAPAASS